HRRFARGKGATRRIRPLRDCSILRRGTCLKKLVPYLLWVFAGVPVSAAQHATVTLIHFSDYHSHAVPFYSEGQADNAGIARVIAYLKPLADDPDTLIFSGGDTMNRGAPAWSDKYQCTEWGWWNGVVDAMAFGNHDADYGAEAFARCRAHISYPILSANTSDG